MFPNPAGLHGGRTYCGWLSSWHFKVSQMCNARGPDSHWYEEQTKMKWRKPTPEVGIDSGGPGRVCLSTSQPWKAVLSQKVEAKQYAVGWIIDDQFLSNQCPHKTMHSLSPWWRERARPVFVPMPLEAKGKSFNALKPLEVLSLKDSHWNQLGWCVSPMRGLSEWPSSKRSYRDREWDKVGEEDSVIEWEVSMYKGSVYVL